MTIEGRPDINVPNDYWQKEYETQRKDRMQDCIDDYLQDEKVDARRVYEEMLSCIDDVINYHKKQLNKATDVKSLMMGHRPLDLNDTSLEDKWMYDKLPERF